jgi:hypothetical protein
MLPTPGEEGKKGAFQAGERPERSRSVGEGGRETLGELAEFPVDALGGKN